MKDTTHNISFILIGILIPGLLAYFLFFDLEGTKIPIKNERVGEGSGVKVTIGEIPSGFRENLRKAFQSPFDLNRYEICLKNRNKIEGPVGSKYLDSKIELVNELGERITEPIDVPGNGLSCGEIELNSFILQNVSVDFPSIEEEHLPTKITLTGDILVDEVFGAQPVDSVRWISTFIFLLAYGFFIELTTKFIYHFKRLIKSLRPKDASKHQNN